MNRILLILISLLTMLLSACASDEKKIRHSAEGFLVGVANYRIEEARPYATPKTRCTTLDFIEKTIIPTLPDEVIQQTTPVTIKLERINLTTDTTATVDYTQTNPNGCTSNQIKLVKRQRKWQVELLTTIPLSSDQQNN
ncbi:MAG: hypothetical protein MJZ81_02665 [Bacteroidales bacterium]|nr:hypothetical protein [Bacteroidales bacterium]